MSKVDENKQENYQDGKYKDDRPKGVGASAREALLMVPKHLPIQNLWPFNWVQVCLG